MKNILLIGGFGYLGGRIAKFLSDNNYLVKITTQKLTKTKHQKYNRNIKVVPLSYDSKIQFNKAFEDIDCLIHLIGPDAHSNKRFKNHKILDYPNFSKRVVEYAELNKIKKIIYFSTVHVYGNNLNGNVDEKTEPIPSHSFAIDHLKVEKIIQKYSKKTKPIILRCSNSFGIPYFRNDKCWDLAVNNFCKSAFQNRHLIVKSGNHFRDFIPIDDITIAVKQLIELKDKNIPNIFNLSTSRTMRIIDVAKMIQNRLKNHFSYSVPIIQNSTNEEIEEKNHFIIKNNLLRSLGYIPNGMWDELDRLLYSCKRRFN